MHDLIDNWSDLQVFLAVAEAGTLSAAAQRLSLTQPSVGRRLTALEEKCGISLFVRDGRRMTLTDAGAAILPSAQRVEREMLSISGTLDTQTRGLAGEVIISAAEGLGTMWLAPEIAQFMATHPDITINVQINNHPVDLLHREADIALRMGRPSEPDLIARKLTDMRFGFYASRHLIPDPEQITSPEDLQDVPRVEFTTGVLGITIDHFLGDPSLKILTSKRPPAYLTNSPAAQLYAVRAGIGYSILSHRWAAMHSSLVQLLPDARLSNVEVWLVTHEDLRHSARIRAVADFIADRVKANRGLFTHGKAQQHAPAA